MEHSKLYQYENVAKVSALDYSGKLAVKTTGDNQYDVSSPVNTAENYSVNEDVIVLSNTLDNEEPMKFSFSFKVNKSAIGTGTNLLLDMPGLFSVKSENNTLWFKFYYEDAPAWKYINASELVDGWNNVALVGDGVKVTLTVNNTIHTVLDSSLKTVYVTYKGGQYKYLQMNETAPLATADSWEIQTIFKCHKSGSASYPCIFGYSGGSDYKAPSLINEGGSYRLYMSSTGNSWDLNTSNTGFIPEDGKTYDIVVGFTGTQYYVKWRLFGTEEWTGNWTLESTTKVYCNVPFYWLNLSLNSYNYYNAGELYMSNTKIIVNGAVWFDGAGDTGFINTDCLRNEIEEGPVYPSLSLGMLKAYQSWLYLKDIEAVKIANASGGDTGEEKPPVQEPPVQEPPVQASDLPNGWAMWEISSGVFRYSKGLPKKDSDGYYDSYALYTNINVDDPLQYRTEDSVVLGESEGSSSKYIIQAKGTPITLIASKIKISGKKGKK